MRSAERTNSYQRGQLQPLNLKGVQGRWSCLIREQAFRKVRRNLYSCRREKKVKKKKNFNIKAKIGRKKTKKYVSRVLPNSQIEFI